MNSNEPEMGGGRGSKKKSGTLLCRSFKAKNYRLFQIKPVEVHHLVPRCHEILHELFFGIFASVDFG